MSAAADDWRGREVSYLAAFSSESLRGLIEEETLQFIVGHDSLFGGGGRRREDCSQERFYWASEEWELEENRLS